MPPAPLALLPWSADRFVGPVTVFSLHARKLVTTGEGGMILTDDGDLAERLRRQRHQGMSLSDYERHGGSPTEFEAYPRWDTISASPNAGGHRRR